MSHLKKFTILALIAFVTFSCSKDDDPKPVVEQPETITELAVATPDLSNLVAALQKADLATTLNGSGSFTVFAPTNTAFTTFLADNGYSSLDDVPVDALTQILLNHVIQGEVKSNQIATGYVKTLADGPVDGTKLSMYLDVSSSVTINGKSKVSQADIDATNGVIHIVDKVIDLPTVVDLAVANPDFSSLVAALGAADGDLVTVLDGEGPFTVLAPDNDAFTTFLDGAALGDVPTDALANILLNHVISGVVTSTDLVSEEAGYTNTLAVDPNDNKLSLYYNTTDGVKFNGVSSVSKADIVTSNGIIHAIDAVIPIPTVVTFATADSNFSTLVSALTTLTPSTDFVSTLNGDGPFTVFAPINAAFDALESVPEESVLTQVLLHHVVSGNYQSADLNSPGDTTVPTLQGDDITITLPGTNGNIADMTDGAGNSDIGIIAVDVQAGNGVIHVINKVLLPQI